MGYRDSVGDRFNAPQYKQGTSIMSLMWYKNNDGSSEDYSYATQTHLDAVVLNDISLLLPLGWIQPIPVASGSAAAETS